MPEIVLVLQLNENVLLLVFILPEGGAREAATPYH